MHKKVCINLNKDIINSLFELNKFFCNAIIKKRDKIQFV